MGDRLVLGGKSLDSKFMLGPGKYDPNLIKACVESAGREMITVTLRRVNTDDTKNILSFVPENVTTIPNTSGVRNADEAARIARLIHEMGRGNFVKIEVMRDNKYLLPDSIETLEATKILVDEGFVVISYMYPDLNFARNLREADISCVIPLDSPIGSSKGLITRDSIQVIISEIGLPVIVNAGIDKPSQACEAMEMGASAIMTNTAIATSGDINKVTEAFALVIKVGGLAHIARLDRVSETGAGPSSPLRDSFK